MDSGLKMLIEPIFYWLVSDKLVLQESVFNKNYLCFRKTELAWAVIAGSPNSIKIFWETNEVSYVDK